MKHVALAVLLTVVQASPPVPRKTPSDATNGSHNVSHDSQSDEANSIPVPGSKPEDSTRSQGGTDQKATKDEQHHVVVDAMPNKDGWDKSYIGLSAVLVLVGALTCGVIGWQSYETRRSADAAQKQAEITLKKERARLSVKTPEPIDRRVKSFGPV